MGFGRARLRVLLLELALDLPYGSLQFAAQFRNAGHFGHEGMAFCRKNDSFWGCASIKDFTSGQEGEVGRIRGHFVIQILDLGRRDWSE